MKRRLDSPPDFNDPRYAGNLAAFCADASRWMRSTYDELSRTERPIKETYTVTNGTVSRSFDADTVNVAGLADVVATVIDDLVTKGLLRTKG